MSFTRLSLAVLVLLLCLPATAAEADRRATKKERADIAKAIGVPKRCLRVRVSTVVARRWSGSQVRNEKASCQDHAADGVAVFKRRRSKWKFVTAGSAFDCPIPKVPRKVQRDLDLPCIR